MPYLKEKYIVAVLFVVVNQLAGLGTRATAYMLISIQSTHELQTCIKKYRILIYLRERGLT